MKHRQMILAAAIALTPATAVAESASATANIPPGKTVRIAVSDGAGLIAYRICLPHGGRVQVEFRERGAWPVELRAGDETFDGGRLGNNCRDFAFGGRSQLSIHNPERDTVAVNFQLIH